MDLKIVLREIEREIKKQFENEGTGHDWHHINRVRNIAMAIQEKEGGDRTVIELAALLHDISDHKFNGGDFDKGALVSDAILIKYGVAEELRDKVTEIVKNVSYKGSGVVDTMPSLEGKIVQDADRIDAIGAIGIARTFAFGGANGRLIYDPDVSPNKHLDQKSYQKSESHTINHFYEKLLLLKERMHTKTARQIAEERTLFMEGFLEQFYKEWRCGR